VDASDECGPQSESYIAINSLQPSVLAAGSNEIFRLPMRGYFSANGGATWLTPNLRVTTVSSNEHDCNGFLPCSGIDYGNQFGDYEGLAVHAGV